MSLRLWLALFILSMALSAELLAWAVRHGQFTDVNRGNVMPLRGTPMPVPRRRPWQLAAMWIALALFALYMTDTLVAMVQFASRP